MLNLVALMGRLTYEPELKSTANGVSVLHFQIAVDRSYQKAGTERQTDFVDCVAWRQTADFISRYFHKGSMIALEGSIQTQNYTDKDGNNRKSVEVVANNVSFCASKNEGGTAATVQQNNSYEQQPAPETLNIQESDFEEIIDDDDDLPF